MAVRQRAVVSVTWIEIKLDHHGHWRHAGPRAGDSDRLEWYKNLLVNLLAAAAAARSVARAGPVAIINNHWPQFGELWPGTGNRLP